MEPDMCPEGNSSYEAIQSHLPKHDEEGKEARKRQLREKFQKQCKDLRLVSEDGEIQGRWKRLRSDSSSGFHLVYEGSIPTSIPTSPRNTTLKEEPRMVPRVVSECSNTGTMSSESQLKDSSFSNCEYFRKNLNLSIQEHTSEQPKTGSDDLSLEVDALEDLPVQEEIDSDLPLAVDLADESIFA